MSRIQEETDNVSVAETCLPTGRLHFAVDRYDCTDAAHRTENARAHTAVLLSLFIKRHGSFVIKPSMTLTPLLNMLLQPQVSRLAGKPILQTNPGCHSHYRVTASLKLHLSMIHTENFPIGNSEKFCMISEARIQSIICLAVAYFRL